MKIVGTRNDISRDDIRNSPPATRLGFSLVEMLIVVAVIAIVASLLLPSLASAKRKSRLTVCLNNQRQQGFGFTMYLQDHDDTYPISETWATFGGKAGIIADNAGVTPAKERPLNAYVGDTEAFSCPSDAGDTGRSIIPESGRRLSCFDAWGTSYCIATGHDVFRVKHVTGFLRTAQPPLLPPMKGSEVAVSPANKIIQGDWNWLHGEDPSWHWAGNRYKYSMLLGDGHCDGIDLSEGKGSARDIPPDPAWKWW